MTLSVIHLYKDVLPQTNCGDCGVPTCLAFASKVVLDKEPIRGCPHLERQVIASVQSRLDEQQAEGKGLKRNLVADALAWAKRRATSMALEDLPARIGGELQGEGSARRLRLPYFTDHVLIGDDGISAPDGEALGRWEQVFLYNHLAQGGSREPTGQWISMEQVPNSVSKKKAMKDHVEEPLAKVFGGRMDSLREAAQALGGEDASGEHDSTDLAYRFRAFPRIPLLLLFWDAEQDEGFGARVKILFDETIVEHLDIESIIFLSERVVQRLKEPS